MPRVERPIDPRTGMVVSDPEFFRVVTAGLDEGAPLQKQASRNPNDWVESLAAEPPDTEPQLTGMAGLMGHDPVLREATAAFEKQAEFQKGDRVLAEDPETGESMPATVIGYDPDTDAPFRTVIVRFDDGTREGVMEGMVSKASLQKQAEGEHELIDSEPPSKLHFEEGDEIERVDGSGDSASVIGHNPASGHPVVTHHDSDDVSDVDPAHWQKKTSLQKQAEDDDGDGELRAEFQKYIKAPKEEQDEAEALSAEGVAPEGWEETVKKMKKHKEITNPWALSWYMKGKGYKPGGKD